MSGFERDLGIFWAKMPPKMLDFGTGYTKFHCHSRRVRDLTVGLYEEEKHGANLLVYLVGYSIE